MEDLKSLSKIINVDNNPYNYLVFQMVNEAFKSVLIAFNFKQIFKKDNVNLRLSHFYHEDYIYKFMAYESNYQIIMHKALALIEKFSQLLINKYQLQVVTGFLDKHLVLVCEGIKIVEIKITNKKNFFHLQGIYEFKLINFFKVLKRVNNFALAPIQIALIPLQLNDKKVRVNASDLYFSLINKYRTFIDNSESPHPLKQKLAKEFKIPVMINVGSNSKIESLDIILTKTMDYYNVKTRALEKFIKEKFETKPSLNLNVIYICGDKKCKVKSAVTNESKLLIKPFNQTLEPTSICQICQKPAKSKYILVKERF
jgi:hypothetical protein